MGAATLSLAGGATLCTDIACPGVRRADRGYMTVCQSEQWQNSTMTELHAIACGVRG